MLIHAQMLTHALSNFNPRSNVNPRLNAHAQMLTFFSCSLVGQVCPVVQIQRLRPLQRPRGVRHPLLQQQHRHPALQQRHPALQQRHPPLQQRYPPLQQRQQRHPTLLRILQLIFNDRRCGGPALQLPHLCQSSALPPPTTASNHRRRGRRGPPRQKRRY